MKPRVLYIASTFPALTVTFIYREIAALRRSGIHVDTVSMNRPASETISGEAKPYLETTHFLDQISLTRKLASFLAVWLRHPLRMLRCCEIVISATPMQGPRDYLRLVYHWIEACHLTLFFRANSPDHVHAHFVNGPASLAMFFGLLRDIPFSFTMHASMIWLDPLALANKLSHCAFAASISDYNRHYVESQYGDVAESKIKIVRCGIEPASIPGRATRSDPKSIEILSIGQMNARKGFHILLEACSQLVDLGVELHCTIVGDGEERGRLEEIHRRKKLEGKVELVGAKTQEEIRSYFEAADIFVLPCVISRNGWRDGIPVVLMEAMAWRIPVVTTDILGLPELVVSEETGILVKPEDPEALALAMQRLAREPALRNSLGAAGRSYVEKEFNVDRSAERLAELFASSHSS